MRIGVVEDDPLGVVLLGIGLTAFFASRGTTTEFTRYVDRSAARDQQVVAILIEQEIRRRDGVAAAAPLVVQLSEVYDREVRVTGPDGVALLQAGQLPPEVSVRTSAVRAAVAPPFVYSLGPGQTIESESPRPPPCPRTPRPA